MIVTGLDHYTIRAVDDIIDECVFFYTNILNLRIGFRPPLEAPGFWLYTGEHPIVHLLVSDHEESDGPAHLGHIAFSAVNLPVTIKRLEDLSIAYTTNYIAETDQFQVFLTDPAGITIELNFPCEKL